MKLFGLPYVEGELRSIAAHLPAQVTLAVFGGAAMARMGLKTATKDIDVVVRTEREAVDIGVALAASGYSEPAALEGPYRRMGARRVIENRDGFRWDVFADMIIGFEFSEGMWSRTTPWMEEGDLGVRQAPAEAIFILKALTERERDRDDMNLLYVKTRPKGLSEAAALYDVPEAGKRIREYVETRGRTGSRPFPRWAEFLQVAEEYGVTL